MADEIYEMIKPVIKRTGNVTMQAVTSFLPGLTAQNSSFQDLINKYQIKAIEGMK